MNINQRDCLECGQCESCIDRSIIEWESHNREMDEPELPMTKREINLWAIHHGISLSPEEVESAVVNGNQDPGEGAEWLPYYKASLGSLAELVGLLSKHLADWQSALRFRGATEKHVIAAGKLVTRFLDSSRSVFPADATADAVTRFLEGHQASGVSPRTINWTGNTLRAFFAWMVRACGSQQRKAG